MNNTRKKYGRIGVLMGGCSSEREVSLKSGQAIYNSLRAQRFDVQAIDLRETDPARVMKILSDKAIDMVFIALHGKFGEDGQIQAVCEELRLPYTGSDSISSKKAFNKISTQSTLLAHNIGVPDFVTLNRKDHTNLGEVIKAIERYPLVVKPACEGSSIGVQVVTSRAALTEAVENAWQLGDRDPWVSDLWSAGSLLASSPFAWGHCLGHGSGGDNRRLVGTA